MVPKMPKIQMISNSRHTYKGRRILVGEQFSVDTQEDADDLSALNFASIVQAPAVVAVAATDEEDTDTTQTKGHTSQRSRNSTYQRRDLTAEK